MWRLAIFEEGLEPMFSEGLITENKKEIYKSMKQEL